MADLFGLELGEDELLDPDDSDSEDQDQSDSDAENAFDIDDGAVLSLKAKGTALRLHAPPSATAMPSPYLDSSPAFRGHIDTEYAYAMDDSAVLSLKAKPTGLGLHAPPSATATPSSYLHTACPSWPGEGCIRGGTVCSESVYCGEWDTLPLDVSGVYNVASPDMNERNASIYYSDL